MAIVETVEAGLAARRRGASLIQLRSRGTTIHSLEALAARLTRESGLPVIVSRRADVVMATGAAGVNLPENDLPVGAARRLLGPDSLIGRSVHDLDGARRAAAEGADYLIFGPVFATPSHPGRAGVGIAALARVVQAVGIPVLAVGGVDGGNLPQCLAAGAAGHAAIRAFK